MTKEVYGVDDIAKMLEVSKSSAYNILAGIRQVSDTLGISGKIHRQDYEHWLQVRKGQIKKDARGINR